MKTGLTVFSVGIDHNVLSAAGFNVVEDIDSAELVIIRTSTPFERLHPYQFFSELQKEGRLNFQAGDKAFMESLLGTLPIEGRLPFELPSSMTAVEAQHSVIPDDSDKPLFPFGFGLTAHKN